MCVILRSQYLYDVLDKLFKIRTSAHIIEFNILNTKKTSNSNCVFYAIQCIIFIITLLFYFVDCFTTFSCMTSFLYDLEVTVEILPFFDDPRLSVGSNILFKQ